MMTDIFQRALGISSPWFIKLIKFDEKSRQLDIYVDFKPGATFIDDAEPVETPKPYKTYDTRNKTWQHLNFFQHVCYLHARVPRIKRDDGHVRMISPPWSGVVSGFTLLFEAMIIQFCKSMPVHNVSQLTGVSDDRIWRILDVYINAARFDIDLSAVTILGMDETSVARGHDYITLFVDRQKRQTIHVSDGKDHGTVEDFIDVLESHNGRRGQIADVSCDMSPAFIKGVSEYLPEAKTTFDKFHILKIINKGVDQVRREEAKANPQLKGSRYIFLKNDANLTEKQKATKAQLSLAKLHLKSVRAMHIRESFQRIYAAKSVEVFELLLTKWYDWATHCQLPAMVKAAKTIKKHWQGVVRWKESEINNGILEGLNSVLQAAKRKARGYKKPHFKTIAYLLTGKLDFSVVNSNCLPT